MAYLEIKRIPYDHRANSQMSIARHYGGMTIDGDYYEFDRDVMKQMAKDPDDGRLYKPDLVFYGKEKKEKVVKKDEKLI